MIEKLISLTYRLFEKIYDYHKKLIQINENPPNYFFVIVPLLLITFLIYQIFQLNITSYTKMLFIGVVFFVSGLGFLYAAYILFSKKKRTVEKNIFKQEDWKPTMKTVPHRIDKIPLKYTLKDYSLMYESK